MLVYDSDIEVRQYCSELHASHLVNQNRLPQMREVCAKVATMVTFVDRRDVQDFA